MDIFLLLIFLSIAKVPMLSLRRAAPTAPLTTCWFHPVLTTTLQELLSRQTVSAAWVSKHKLHVNMTENLN